MKKEKTYTFKAEKEHKRLDIFVKEYLDLLGYDISRANITKLIKQGQISINKLSVKPSKSIKVGDLIDITLSFNNTVARPLIAQDIPIRVVYEDNDILVVNKQAGIVTHPGPGHPDSTLINAVLYHTNGVVSDFNKEQRPGVVHRLDKDTSGLIVFAKNNYAHMELARQFMEKIAKRTYIAVVKGIPKSKYGHIETLYGRNPKDRVKWSSRVKEGKTAITNYYLLRKYGQNALLMLKLETGRTHQIRVHLSENSMPIVGDQTYGKARHGLINRQALHAVSLSLIHPTLKVRQTFCVPIETDIRNLIRELHLEY